MPDPLSPFVATCRLKVGEGLVGRCAMEGAGPVCLTSYSGNDELISNIIAPAFNIGNVQVRAGRGQRGGGDRRGVPGSVRACVHRAR